MLQKLKHIIEKQEIKAEDPLLLAVSGGVDSMLLWHLLSSLEFNITIAHVNYQLRGEDSLKDAQLVRQIAKDRGQQYFEKTIDTKAYKNKHNLGTQEAARNIRYDFFEEIKEQYDYKYLLTAHHLDDRIETLFINLLRGTGINGLKSITSHDQIFRPLLSFTKTEIECEAKRLGISYRTDRSNTSNNYRRNWLRNQIIPEIEEEVPAIKEVMRANFENFEIAADLLEQLKVEELAQLQSLFSDNNLPIDELLQLKLPQLSLYEFLKPQGFSRDQIKQLVTAIEERSEGAIFENEQLRLQISRDKLYFLRKTTQEDEILIFDNSLITQPVFLKVSIVNQQKVELAAKNVEYFNADKIAFPLILRRWKTGDAITPLGMKGKKKISDIITDDKLDPLQKERLFVLCKGEDIIWLIGNRISEHYKVKSNTQKLLKIEWRI